MQYDDPDDEFLDPVTRELIVDPVVGSDGNTYDRCRSHLVVRLSHSFLVSWPGKQWRLSSRIPMQRVWNHFEAAAAALD